MCRNIRKHRVRDDFMLFLLGRRYKMIKLLKNTIENTSAFFTNICDEIVKKIKKAIKYFKNNKKWKLYLYLNGQCIKCLKIDKDFAPMNKIYVVKVRNKRHLLGTNKPVQIVVRSYKLYISTHKRFTEFCKANNKYKVQDILCYLLDKGMDLHE